MTPGRVGFWLLLAATLAVYVAMVAWSLPHVAAAAGGAAPFDLRPGGYTFKDARDFLSALTPEGRDLYLNVQQRLDLFYPALLAATLFFAIRGLVAASRPALRWSLAATALPGALFDYLENHAVARLLVLGPAGISPADVATANRWTLLKSGFSTLAMAILLILLLVWCARRIAARRNANPTA